MFMRKCQYYAFVSLHTKQVMAIRDCSSLYKGIRSIAMLSMKMNSQQLPINIDDNLRSTLLTCQHGCSSREAEAKRKGSKREAE